MADSGPRFVEYPLGPGTLGLWTAARVLLTAVAACAAAALVGLLFLLGVVEEAAFGSLGMAIDLDAWSQAWMGMTFFGGVIGLGLAALPVSSASRWALRRRLVQLSEGADAGRGVPVAWQREVLSKDPLEGIRHLGTALRLVGAVMTVLSALLAIGVAMDGGGRAGEKSLVGAAITVAFALAWLAGVLVRRAFARRDLPSDPAAAMWGEDAVSSASATAEAIQTGQTAAPDRHMAGRVRSWLRRTGTAILGVVAGVTAALCFFMLFVRKPGRRSPERVFSTGGEDGIDLFWRFLVVVGLTTMCAFVLGWLTVLAIDAWSTRVLWVRARRADADTERPSEHVLRSVLDSQAVSLRLGRSLVAVATVAGSMAGSMPSVEPGDLFDIEARTAAAGVVSAAATWCRLSAVVVAVGVALIVAGVSVERRWREQIRSVWPIAERSAPDVRA